MRDRVLFSVLAFLLVVHSAAAQQQAPSVRQLPVDISVDELQRRFTAALGGDVAWSTLRTAVSRGTIEIAGLDQVGKYESYERAPGSALIRITMPGGLESVEGCDGRTAWEKDADGVKVLKGAELQDALADCVFLALVDLKRTYKELKIAGKSSQDGQEFYLVDAIRANGVNDVLYIDAKTYLLTLFIGQRHMEGRLVAIPTLLADYRSVGGVKMPHVLRTKIGDMTMTVRLGAIEFNAPVDDAMFALPK